jgi:hypothetical protein
MGAGRPDSGATISERPMLTVRSATASVHFARKCALSEHIGDAPTGRVCVIHVDDAHWSDDVGPVGKPPTTIIVSDQQMEGHNGS